MKCSVACCVRNLYQFIFLFSTYMLAGVWLGEPEAFSLLFLQHGMYMYIHVGLSLLIQIWQ